MTSSKCTAADRAAHGVPRISPPCRVGACAGTCALRHRFGRWMSWPKGCEVCGAGWAHSTDRCSSSTRASTSLDLAGRLGCTHRSCCKRLRQLQEPHHCTIPSPSMRHRNPAVTQSRRMRLQKRARLARAQPPATLFHRPWRRGQKRCQMEAQGSAPIEQCLHVHPPLPAGIGRIYPTSSAAWWSCENELILIAIFFGFKLRLCTDSIHSGHTPRMDHRSKLKDKEGMKGASTVACLADVQRLRD